jgi:hypothetical protein
MKTAIIILCLVLLSGCMCPLWRPTIGTAESELIKHWGPSSECEIYSRDNGAYLEKYCEYTEMIFGIVAGKGIHSYDYKLTVDGFTGDYVTVVTRDGIVTKIIRYPSPSFWIPSFN